MDNVQKVNNWIDMLSGLKFEFTLATHVPWKRSCSEVTCSVIWILPLFPKPWLINAFLLLTFIWLIFTDRKKNYRSPWPRDLRHEMSSPAQILGSWVRMSLESCMYVWFYSVFVLSYEGSGLSTADLPSKESYRLSRRVIIPKLFLNGNRPENLILQVRRKGESQSWFRQDSSSNPKNSLCNIWQRL
jgi:hypothetical protein